MAFTTHHRRYNVWKCICCNRTTYNNAIWPDWDEVEDIGLRRSEIVKALELVRTVEVIKTTKRNGCQK
mgnify:CR=1 FL=1